MLILRLNDLGPVLIQGNFRFNSVFSPTKVDNFLPGYVTKVTYAECLTFSRAGYVRDKRSTSINALPNNQSDQSMLMENGIAIHDKSLGAPSADHERV